MKKEKFLENIIGAIIILFYGAILVGSKSLGLLTLQEGVSIFFALYGMVALGIYIFSKKDKNVLDLITGIIGLLFGIGSFIFELVMDVKTLAFLILAWTLIISFIKLKQADLYHDRKSKLWYIEITSLILFLFLSVLISMNLAYDNDIQMLIFGFYAIYHGIFELYESIFLNLTRGKFR